MPLITDLKNVAMRSRHWQQIREDLGRSFDEASAEFTLERIVEFGFDTHAEFINQVSSSASKELIIETVSVTFLHTHSLQYMHILSFFFLSLSLTHTQSLICAGAGEHAEHVEHARAGHRALQGQGPLQSAQHGRGVPGARRPPDQTRYKYCTTQ